MAALPPPPSGGPPGPPSGGPPGPGFGPPPGPGELPGTLPPPGYPPAPPSGYPPSFTPQYPYAGATPQWGGVAMPTIKAGPAPGLQYAGFWIRFVSYLIDVIPIGILGAVLNVSTGTGIHCVTVNGAYTCNTGTGALGSWIGFLVLGGYWVLTWSLLGASLGQKALGMRVVNAADGQSIDIGKAVLRYVGFVISFIPLALGLIWAGFDARKQGWHDKIAGTYVVRQY